MPTRHPRHSVTETPAVREALDELRRRDIKVELGDLVMRGARDRVREHDAADREERHRALLRARMVERLRTGEGIDLDALREVREHGWTH
jgi:hypothetical protein